jgi:hypothetical protein
VFGEDLEENMFGVGTTIEEYLHALVYWRIISI